MTPAKKKPAPDTAIVFQGASNVEWDRRLHLAGIDTARVEIRIEGVKIPKNAKAFIKIVPTAGTVTMFDELAEIDDSHTKPPF